MAAVLDAGMVMLVIVLAQADIPEAELALILLWTDRWIRVAPR